MKQFPKPGEHLLFFRGDIAFFSLNVSSGSSGRAYLRTNLGKADIQRREIVLHCEQSQVYRGENWHDIEMIRIDDSTYTLSLALTEVGHFEAKCFFFPEDEKEPKWVGGDNLHINIEPAEYCCGNSIYCAFVRQFGANKSMPVSDKKDLYISNINRLDQKGYAVIPPSGTFRNLIRELDFIVDELNCRIVHLLPVNPVPTVYARMGRFGSPYASLDFTGIDPALAEFDKRATPLDQFCELVDAVHLKNAKLFLDIAINHTGWAAKIHEEHPEWLVREPNGEIHSPGAWGVTWGDLTELDSSRLDLWEYLADMFLTWCERGVDGFRCDAGYMIPVKAWEYIIAKVRMEYPDTIFLLEGLGGDPAVTNMLLDKANMNWAYSELFQNYSKDAISSYISSVQKINKGDGIMVHYAETHDNNRLAATSENYAKMRTTLSAFLSANGAFGFTNGVEWFAEEKIDVHEASALNWGAEKNQVEHIARLNTILQTHPAFFNNAEIKFIETFGTSEDIDSDTLGFLRYSSFRTKQLLILCNLNCSEETLIIFHKKSISSLGDYNGKLIDLITEENITPADMGNGKLSVMVQPGQILSLSRDLSDLHAIAEFEDVNIQYSDRIAEQSAMAMALDIITWMRSSNVMLSLNTREFAASLIASPEKFCSGISSCAVNDNECDYPSVEDLPYVHCNIPSDLRRNVMIPPGHAVLVTAPYRFRAKFADNEKIIVQRGSLVDASGRHFALFAPLKHTKEFKTVHLKIALYSKDNLKRESSLLTLLPNTDINEIPVAVNNCELRKSHHLFMASNGLGGICRANVRWGEVSSKYDALLAANMNSEIPVDRHIFWSRCRIHLIHHAHTQVFSIDTLESFHYEEGRGVWDFNLPAGNGLFVKMRLTLSMLPERNVTVLKITRTLDCNDDICLDNDFPVRIIFRPDIENRNFHHDTIADPDLMKVWESSVGNDKSGFTFQPDDAVFSLKASKGKFHRSSEWISSLYHEVEATRGLKAEGDLFSPGYFDVTLAGNESVVLIGEAVASDEKLVDVPKLLNSLRSEHHSGYEFEDIEKIMVNSLEQFIVKRNELKTVIAGYPWFLDWGRDTLICVRGLIAAGMFDDVEKILMQFAKFAKDGMLPNIIYGDTVGNWDTSDAPLWFFTACRDFSHQMELSNITGKSVPGKDVDLLSVLVGIADGYIKGTPNGIKVDEKSGLVFSPSHFTWMDTNYPAGTPREGYPIEIQALWYAALNFLFEQSGDEKWKTLADKVRASVTELFVTEEGWLSDCLHCKPGESAADATPDDALRCNQIFAITLGLIEDGELRKSILKAAESLLVPGAIRTLADRRVTYPLPVLGEGGKNLNDPYSPYWGYYDGDEDTRRKPAYHNGTAWTWPFPSYAEAYLMTYGNEGRDTAKAILSSSLMLFNEGCVGHIPEIIDGNIPHRQRGCDAQAWGVSELLRVWKTVTL
jgi:predicted glycogen debranching enzyme